MDDVQLVEIIENVSQRLRADLPDLDSHLDRAILADYRTASPGLLQEALIQVVHNLDARIANDARKIQRLIARSESTAPLAPPQAANHKHRDAWTVNDPQTGGHREDEALDPKLAQGVRYLSLPAVADDDNVAVHEVLEQAIEVRSTGNQPAAVMNQAVEGRPATTALRLIPSRLGQQLAGCTTMALAVRCVRKHIPALRGLTALQFLSAINFPASVASPDALRFSGFVGMIDADASDSTDAYHAVLQRASRIMGVPLAHVGRLIGLYSGAHKVKDYKPICGRNPRCSACKLSGRCSFYALRNHDHVSAVAPEKRRTIKEWAVDERPRERLLAGERLANSELLAIILRTGSGQMSAVEVGREIMNEFKTLHDLEKASPQDIVSRMKGKGVGPAKAAEISAALELGRRVAMPGADTRLGMRQVTSSRDIFELCRARYKAATQEEFLLLILNTKNKIQKEVPVSLGTLNSSIVHPRDVFRHALREAAAAVIFVHNHPSGDPAPSNEDILLTARLVDIGKLLGIQVLDHVIIGSHEFYSFADHGRLK